MSLPLIEGLLKRQLRTAAMAVAPAEACGVIYDEVSYPLENHAEHPEDSFEIHLDELRALLDRLEVPILNIRENVFIWHSHPSGGVGPSTFDLTHKTPLAHHLVVSLVDDDVVATWY